MSVTRSPCGCCCGTGRRASVHATPSQKRAIPGFSGSSYQPAAAIESIAAEYDRTAARVIGSEDDVALKVCAEPGCPELVRKGRCPTHARAKDAARGRRQARGYDTAYDNERRHYQKRMDKGERFDCWRCAELGKPHIVDPLHWHLGHHNQDRSIIRGPQCPASNLDTSTSPHA